jgi:hypothetical protein
MVVLAYRGFKLTLPLASALEICGAAFRPPFPHNFGTRYNNHINNGDQKFVAGSADSAGVLRTFEGSFNSK